MKKFILTFLIVSAYSLLSIAQITIKPGGGFNYLKLTQAPGNWDRYGGIGYQAGSTVLIGGRFYFESGVFWMTNFSELSQIDYNELGPVRLDHKLSMLRIPVLGGYTIIDGKGSFVDFRVFLGPVFYVPTQVNNSSYYVDAPTKEDYSNLFWDGSFGLSVAYWWLFADAAYEFGFSEVYKDTGKFNSGKANNFIVNIGVRIRL